MATGPEHYREAERLVAVAVRHITETPQDMRISEVSAAAAQVHATLALTAATALAGFSSDGMSLADAKEWDKAASFTPGGWIS